MIELLAVIILIGVPMALLYTIRLIIRRQDRLIEQRLSLRHPADPQRSHAAQSDVRRA